MKERTRLAKPSHPKPQKLSLCSQDISFPRIGQSSKLRIDLITKSKDKKQLFIDQLRNKLQELTKRTSNINSTAKKRKMSVRGELMGRDDTQKNLDRDRDREMGRDSKNYQRERGKENVCMEDGGKFRKVSKKCDTIDKAQPNINNQKDETLVEVRMLFGNIQDRLKSPHMRKNRQITVTLPSLSLYRSNSLTNLLTRSQIIPHSPNNNHTTTKPYHNSSLSLLASPRQQLLIQKGAANQNTTSMVATLGHEMGRLEEFKQRNQEAIREFMVEKMRCMDIDVYRVIHGGKGM